MLLPREIRELFTMIVVWRMAVIEARNTLRREAFDEIIREAYDGVLQLAQMKGVSHEISSGIRAFEKRFKEDNRADRVERITSEIASASLFVSDPAGGQNNLRFPHKQFYEYVIAKAGWSLLYAKPSAVARLLAKNHSNARTCEVILSET